MNTLALSEPCGVCACCRAGGRCARMLLLDANGLRALAKVRAVVPDPTGRTIQLRPNGAGPGMCRAEPEEPTVSAICSRCGEEHSVLAYVANTLKLRGVPLPPCAGCRFATGRTDIDG